MLCHYDIDNIKGHKETTHLYEENLYETIIKLW